MAGYVRKGTIKLEFDESHELGGLEVRMRRQSTDKALDLVDLAAGLAEMGDKDRDDFGIEDLRALRGQLAPLFEAFAESLVSWNMQQETDDGEDVVDVPATLEGLRSLDLFDEAVPLITAWVETIAGTSRELGKDSPSGPRFPEASLPTVPLSPNLQSSSVPA